MKGRILAATAIVCLLLGGRYAVAFAHAMLVSAEPRAGVSLASAPPRVRLVFSEEIEPSLAVVTLTSETGVERKLVAAGDPHDVHAIIAPVDALDRGTWRVTWRVVSADGHPVGGSYAFGVGVSALDTVSAHARATDAGASNVDASAASWGVTIAGAPWLPALLRGAGLAALMAFAGLLLFLSWPVQGGGEPAARVPAGAATPFAIAAPLLLIGHAIAWAVNAAADHSLSVSSLMPVLTSGVGRVELWRVGAVLLAVWAQLLARRTRLALLFAGLALVESGAAGHSAALHPAIAIPMKALHLVAAAAWLGGVLWLLAVYRHDAAVLPREAARVSDLALKAVIAVALSGVVQILAFVPAPLALLGQAYGAVVVAKIVGLGVLVAFGAYHRNTSMPRLERGAAGGAEFAVILRREVLVLVAVTLLGGLLAYVPTPRESGAAASPTSNTGG